MLLKHIRAGRVARLRRGIYRLVHFPASENEELVVVWLWSDRVGVFSHQTALALSGLSDVLPTQIHLTLPSDWCRRRLRKPESVVVHFSDLRSDERAWFGQRFGVDVAFGDPMIGEPDVVTSEDILDFADIAPPTLRLYPIETHIAEKLHAYTMPRQRPNTRVKDLPDLALLASAQALDSKRLRAALEQTFDFRKTHPLPLMIPEPPQSWTAPYAAMARDDQLIWSTLADATAAVRAFLDPVLAENIHAAWDPETWDWRPL